MAEWEHSSIKAGGLFGKGWGYLAKVLDPDCLW
jgi:hypothetical protein